MWDKLLIILNWIQKIMLKIFGYKESDNKGIVYNNSNTKLMTGNSGFANQTQPVLVTCGGDPIQVAVCSDKNDTPYGVYIPESFQADENKVKIQILGTGIMKMVAGGTITKGQIVYSSGSGEVTATPNAGEQYYNVGVAMEDGARGDCVKVNSSVPVLVTA